MSAVSRTRRNTNRAEDYDYSVPGSYFVTVCTHKLHAMFGDVIDGEMHLNAFGRIVEEEWFRTAALRSDVELDAFIVMPNHFHGIVVLNRDEDLVRARRCLAREPGGLGSLKPRPFDDAAAASVPDARARQRLARTNEKPSSLGEVVGHIKSASARRINRLRNTPGAPVWHRNFYDHIIRDERDMDRVRAYVMDNPTNWQYDRANRKETLAL